MMVDTFDKNLAKGTLQRLNKLFKTDDENTFAAYCNRILVRGTDKFYNEKHYMHLKEMERIGEKIMMEFDKQCSS